MAIPDDTVSIVIAGQTFTGWQSVRISRSCEKMPPSFDVLATERDPGTGALALLPPGAPCQVMIGSDIVLSGFVDRYSRSITPIRHETRIQGRGKTEDLVDCDVTSDILTGMQIVTSSFLDLAMKLGKPYGVSVRSLTGGNVPVAASADGGPLQFNASLQQTVFEVLQETSRYAGVLIYEDTDGTLLLANVGTSTMASGFAQGVNVQAAAFTSTMDERFSQYLPTSMSTGVFADQGAGGISFQKTYDRGVPRFRQKVIVSPQFQFGQSFAERCAQWEAARRWGRSSALHVSVDSWRDSAGTLWTVNAFAPIDLPALKLTPVDQWIVGSVDFVRDAERGTVADLVLMPKEAFTPQPIILMPAIPTDTPSAGGGAAPGPAVDLSSARAPLPGSGVPPAGGGAAR